jgi:phage tail sheath protein FI
MPGQKLDLDMVKAVQSMMIAHCERMGDRVAILDTPPGLSPQEVRKWRMDIAAYDSSYAVLYYPWIQVNDPVQKRPVYIPSSGHMAGIWARTDTTRGVHKAPANEVVRGATGLAYNVTKGEQDTLNPNGVNCIRAFPGMGIRVWGARTLANDPAWRYVNVRRLFNFVEKSIERGTMWVVFEPNNPRLWARVTRDVTAFLTTVWRTGALFGSTPDQAFYVKCDEELNPPESRDLGRLIVEIGLAPVKPAEFVIFRITQWAGGGAEAGGEGGEEAGGEASGE